MFKTFLIDALKVLKTYGFRDGATLSLKDQLLTEVRYLCCLLVVCP